MRNEQRQNSGKICSRDRKAMRFISHIRVCTLLVIGSFGSLSYAQTSTAISHPVELGRLPFSAACVSSKITLPDFWCWTKPQERIPGLNVSADCLPQEFKRIQMQPNSLKESLCPKDCQLCGVIYDKATPIRICTKG